MSVKVSVVVPVYNPGSRLDLLIASLARQSMSSAEFEVVFVDDGSTDGTGDRLEALAAARANTRVIRTTNSRWPGRPRNLGIDASQGDYVLLVDHDDELGDEALERMYDYAAVNESDVVVGKEVRRGKGWFTGPLFRQDVPATTLREMPELVLLLTPHKMFRRTLLVDNGIRFLEGPRRLEDHPFVMEAYFRAKVVSVLASYTCYYWHNHRDSAGTRDGDWPRYFASMHDVLDVVEEHTDPGAFRDRLLLHWYADKGIRRLGTELTRGSRRDAADLMASLRALTLSRFPASLDAQLQGVQRVRAALLRAGDLGPLHELAEWEDGLRLEQAVHDLRQDDGRLLVGCTLTLVDARREPVRLELRDGRWMWSPPPVVPVDELPPEALDFSSEIRRHRFLALARRRGDDEAFRLPTEAEPHPDSVGGSWVAGGELTVVVDPRRCAGGHAMTSGTWAVEVMVRTCGLRVQRRLALPGTAQRLAGGVVVSGNGLGPVTGQVRAVVRRLRRLARER